jgi:hypothetical protein
MAIYSDEKRPILAKWIKITLLINVVLFLLLVLVWLGMVGPMAALTHTGNYATLLIGLNVAAFLIYESLYRPDDDPVRRVAEILGSLQVVIACVTLVLILGTIALAFSPGLAGLFPVTGSKPAAASEMPTIVAAAATQVAAQPTECYRTATGCLPMPPAPTIPLQGARMTSSDDPILGSYIFDKFQFDPKQNYFSRAGNYDYRYLSVPLDHSPDIKWTFRDDGVILFSYSANGSLLRTGIWSTSQLSTGKTEYKIMRGNYDYRGSFSDDNKFRITSPDFWNMTKVG